jgi:hypothetical protein
VRLAKINIGNRSGVDNRIRPDFLEQTSQLVWRQRIADVPSRPAIFRTSPTVAADVSRP